MSNPRSARVLSGIILASALLTASSPGQDVTEYEKRLNRLASQIESLKGTIQREENQKSTVLSRLGRLGLQKKVIINEIELYDTQRRKAESEMRALEKKLPEIRERLNSGNRAIARILVGIYKFGRLKTTGLLLQTEDIGGMIMEHKHLTLLARHQEQVIAGYLGDLEALKNTKNEIQARSRTIDSSLTGAREKQRDLARQENRFQSLVKQIDQDLQTHKAALEEQRERAEQLQILMKELLEDETAMPFPLLPLYEKKGRIPWPISGRVISRFGNQRHPRFKTVTKNNGIEIGTSSSMIVKAVHPGMVVFTDYFDGYGYLVIIDHGMAYYSLYGHCSPEFLVKKGDPVKEGQPIAYVADIGSLKGTSLYFEIRFKSKALNPLQWLKQR